MKIGSFHFRNTKEETTKDVIDKQGQAHVHLHTEESEVSEGLYNNFQPKDMVSL